MSNFIIAFLTGLTTGGLSCLAVQGGLLASSVAQEIEKEYHPRLRHGKSRSKSATPPNSALPILLFLGAKIAAYTILGLLLGWLGSMLQLTPTMQAVLFIGIGIFMLGNALRMLDVHPVFRYFAIQPPRFLTRFIRRTAKNGESYATPLFLGALTVFIPCGVTQAMMAVAMGTGNPLQAAAIMLAFTLGTSPVFFLVAYLATQLGARLEKWFLRLTAIVVLGLGLISINSGLTLAGSRFAVGNWSRPEFSGTPALAASELTITARNDGYYPGVLYAKAGAPVTLTLVTEDNRSCSRSFVIPSLKIQKLLPQTGLTQIELPPQRAGKTIYFSCSMGMYSGWIIFQD
jgi:sulfite exporter TauE/SafE